MHIVQNRCLVILFILGFSISCLAQRKGADLTRGGTYLQIQAKSGEDAVVLLQRYGLYEYGCNIAQFFKINKLPEDFRLKPGTSYKIPVLEFVYNGKSIRTSLKIDDWQTAKRIEQYNRRLQASGVRADDFVATRKLWVPWHELNCDDVVDVTGETSTATSSSRNGTGELSSAKGQRIYPIFGKKYENTPLVSKKLKGKVFYIVSGHGGPDTGAQGQRAGNTLCEDEYAYDVALRLLRLLVSNGAVAYMIVRDPNDGIRDELYLRCDSDELVLGDKEIPRPQKERLQQRCDIINALTEENKKKGLKDQTLIEIHVDSRSHQTKTDAFFYYRAGSEPSRALAMHIHQTFLNKYLKIRGQQRYNGTVSARNLHMLDKTETSKAVYIEMANIRNDWDQQRLVLKNNRQALANWIYTALITQ